MIFVLRRKIIYRIFWGLMFCLGTGLGRIPEVQQVLAPSKSDVAIVIDDFGGNAKGIREMMELPFPLTFAVMPFEEHSREQAEAAVSRNFEVIVHMPFEAFHAQAGWYGKKHISTSSPNSEIRRLIEEAFQILPMATGMSNHMGSKATADPRIMAAVLEETARLNRFFFNSKTAYHSPIARLTASLGLPYLERDLFLDQQASPQYIHEQLQELIDLSRRKGVAVGIGHVGTSGPVLAEILKREIPRYRMQGIRLVRLSELLDARPVRGPTRQLIVGIDPGHGGIDSGAKSGKILEKDINLTFSRKLAQELRKQGFQAVLTKSDDRLLTPYASYEYRGRPYKRDDLERRILVLEAAGARVIISIHINWHPDSDHRGPIAYYSACSEDSQKLAQSVQEQFNRAQPYRKLPKPLQCYLLGRSKVPIILVELGFLSNRQDRSLLQSDSYQNQLITAIIAGLKESRITN